MEDPFLLHVMHLQDYFSKKIKELDEKSNYYTEDIITKKQEELMFFLDELENDLPPRPTDGISFKQIRSQKEQQAPSDFLMKNSGSLTPRQMNSDSLFNQDVTQSHLFYRNEPTYMQNDKNVRHSDILSGQPKGIRSTSQQHGTYNPMHLNDPVFKSTIERTTIFISKEKR